MDWAQKKDTVERIALFAKKKSEYFTNILIHTVFALNIVAMTTMVFQDYKKAKTLSVPTNTINIIS